MLNDGQALVRRDAVRDAMRRYAAADAAVYRALLVEFGWRLAA